MTMRLTRRVPGLLAASIAIYLLATNSEVVWLYGLTGLLLALLPIGVVAPAIAVRRFRVAPHGIRSQGFIPPLAIDRGKAFAGDTVILALDCRGNPQACRLGRLRTRSGRTLEGGNFKATMPPLGPVDIRWTAGRRGEIQVAAVEVTSSWPLGLATARRWIPLRATLVVHPHYVVPGGDSIAGAATSLGAAGLRGLGEEFVGLREYRTGDSQRRVHWPTTARTGTLMVVETLLESHEPPRYTLRAAAGATDQTVDLAVVVAASLAAGAVASARPFRLRLPGERGDLTSWNEALTRLALAAPEVTGDGPDDGSTAIIAHPGEVEVRTDAGGWRLPAGATLGDVAEALAARRERATR